MDDMKKTPVYRNTNTYAAEHNELEQYWQSQRANTACAEAIDKAIGDHFDGYSLETENAIKEVLQQFGRERMLHVLANTVQHEDHDGRYSRKNIDWAHSYPSTKDINVFNRDMSIEYLLYRSHPGLVDIFLKYALRDADKEKKPSIRAQLAVKPEQHEKAEAKAHSREEAR